MMRGDLFSSTGLLIWDIGNRRDPHATFFAADIFLLTEFSHKLHSSTSFFDAEEKPTPVVNTGGLRLRSTTS